MKKSDPCRAAKLLAQDVRRDWQGSGNSLAALGRIDNPCAVGELIRLMDLPDGHWVDHNTRQWIAERVEATAKLSGGPIPRYDPGGSMDLRQRQEKDWENWYVRQYGSKEQK